MNRGSWHWQIVCSHNRCSPAGSLSLANRTGNRTHICFKLLWLRVVLCCQPSCWPWPFPFLNVDKAHSPFASTKQTNEIISAQQDTQCSMLCAKTQELHNWAGNDQSFQWRFVLQNQRDLKGESFCVIATVDWNIARISRGSSVKAPILCWAPFWHLVATFTD